MAQEEEMIKTLCANIISSGANAVFCQKDIDDLAIHYLAKAGIFAIKRIKKSKMEALKKATGALFVSGLDTIEKDDIGYASGIDEIRFGDYYCTIVQSDKTTSVTAVLRGSTGHAVDEIERAWADSMGVVYLSATSKLIAGGGSSYAHLARHLKLMSLSRGDRQGMAINAFANALESIPRTLAENSGCDPVDALLNLRKTIDPEDGINTEGEVVNMREQKVIEPRKVVETALGSATEAAIMILRIDDVISMKGGGGGGMMPPMPPGMG
jgi:chaperonin GroEL (HSP60 family)